MCLIDVGVNGLVAIVALHETRQEMVNGVLNANCLRNSPDVLKKLPLLRVRHKPWILRPRASDLFYFCEILIDFLFLFLTILVVYRRPPLLYHLQGIILLLQLVTECVDFFLRGFAHFLVDVIQRLVLRAVARKAHLHEAIKDVVCRLVVFAQFLLLWRCQTGAGQRLRLLFPF